MPISAKPTEFTASSLAVEFKMDRRRVGQLLQGLEPHRTVTPKGKGAVVGYYWMRDVLDHLMKPDEEGEGEKMLNPEQEQARLANARRLKIEVETKVLNGELLYRDDVANLITNHITNCKSRLRSIPHKIVHRIMAATDHAEGLRLAENEIEEALNELAGIGFEEPDGEHSGDNGEGVDPATETDGIAVG